MGNGAWLQKVLYVIMAVLAVYIVWKGTLIFLEGRTMQRAMEQGKIQQPLEDAAMETIVPGYTASVKERTGESWMGTWMKQVVPVYSYLTLEDIDEEADTEYKREETEMSPETETSAELETNVQEAAARIIFPAIQQQLNDFNYLLSNYYTVDAGTAADEVLLDVNQLLEIDLTLEQDSQVPQILIYHTHAHEAFVDSREGEIEDTVVGMGEVLAEQLRQYGYQVIHDTGVYDLIDGVLDRSAAYDHARAAVEQILKKHPTIEVIVDLHRDGVEGTRFVTEIGGKPAAKIMFFNGISRDAQSQELSWLPNEYLTENLAFSLQLELLARELYPGFTRNIYLKAERYNLHLRPRSLLVEAGTQLNTVEEERNAMEPLAKLIHLTLAGFSE